MIHFAGLKAAGESVKKPSDYYFNNLVNTISLADACNEFNVTKFVFSSSATVYGDNAVPFTEDMPLRKTTNPDGEIKAMCERILNDISNAKPGFAVSLLRNFNPVGAHARGLIGELPDGIPNNLMPYITHVVCGKLKKFKIFGNSYDSPEGTCVRDYIHVVDNEKDMLRQLKNSRMVLTYIISEQEREYPCLNLSKHLTLLTK